MTDITVGNVQFGPKDSGDIKDGVSWAQQEITRLTAEVAELRNWIRQEGVNSDTCTYNILREICEGCNCKRRPLPPAPTTEAT